jgi:hypothetical protein
LQKKTFRLATLDPDQLERLSRGYRKAGMKELEPVERKRLFGQATLIRALGKMKAKRLAKASSQAPKKSPTPISPNGSPTRGLKASADQLPAEHGLSSDDRNQTDLVEEAEKPAKTAGSSYGASNKLVTQARAEVLRERLKAKLKGELRSGIDPEILA